MRVRYLYKCTLIAGIYFSLTLSVSGQLVPVDSSGNILNYNLFSRKYTMQKRDLLLCPSCFHVFSSYSFMQQVDDEVEDEVEDEIEDKVEDEIEDQVEDEIEDEVEDEIEDQVEDEIEDEVEDEIEDQVEDEIEDEVEDEIEDQVEDEIEDEVEDEIEDEVEDEIEDEVEDEIEDEVEDEIKDGIEDQVEGEIEEQVENEVEGDSELEDEIGQGVNYGVKDQFADKLDSSSKKKSLNKFKRITEDNIEHQLDIIYDTENYQVFSNDWLVLASAGSLLELSNDGYVIDNKRYLLGLELFLATLKAPKSYALKQDKYEQLIALNSPNIAVDVNHIYRLAQQTTEATLLSNTGEHRSAENITTENRPLSHRIGMIDSGINTLHPSLVSTEITTRQFTSTHTQGSNEHGTAIASILIGQDKSFIGMLPGQKLWSAAVFFPDQEGNQITTTVDLIQSISWLLESNVDIINMSFSGPPNRLVQVAVKRACERGIILVAAVGNAGPASKPQYPAAYPCTLAVTAIDRDNHIYRYATRGDHIDLAAYGVDIIHAHGPMGYHQSSGTSFAVPLISAWLASSLPQAPEKRLAWIELQLGLLEDLGQEGKDSIFGYGALPSHLGSHLIKVAN